MRKRAIAAGTLGIALLAGVAEADDLGQSDYTVFCAACHGEAGAEDGPVGGNARQPRAPAYRVDTSQ